MLLFMLTVLCTIADPNFVHMTKYLEREYDYEIGSCSLKVKKDLVLGVFERKDILSVVKGTRLN